MCLIPSQGGVLMTEIDELRSPTRKLIRLFMSSRDGWKAKCVDAKYELKLLKRKPQRYLSHFTQIIGSSSLNFITIH